MFLWADFCRSLVSHSKDKFNLLLFWNIHKSLIPLWSNHPRIQVPRTWTAMVEHLKQRDQVSLLQDIYLFFPVLQIFPGRLLRSAFFLLILKSQFTPLILIIFQNIYHLPDFRYREYFYLLKSSFKDELHNIYYSVSKIKIGAG
jgi:hypothetical protein